MAKKPFASVVLGHRDEDFWLMYCFLLMKLASFCCASLRAAWHVLANVRLCLHSAEHTMAPILAYHRHRGHGQG